VLHASVNIFAESVRLVPYESHNHAVEVEEEHDEVKAEFEERFLLVDIKLPEDLCCVEQVLVLVDFSGVESEQRQVKDDCDPVTINQEEEGEESMYCSLGYDVGIQSVAQVDRIDIVTFKITVHDGEKHL